MKLTHYRLAQWLWLALLFSAHATPAQTSAFTEQGNSLDDGTGRVTQDVTIIIQQQQVRFVAPRAGEEMRLQVFDQSGALVYDSGDSVQAELIWALRNGNGETLKSGLYAYVLSLKETGAETARVRRGHFIVDRAQDRDAATDKLWVTSQGAGAVGAELTVAQDENAAIAGASTHRDNSSNVDLPQRTGEEKKAAAQSQKSEAAAVFAGTVGRIAKFTTATDLGDSALVEQGGNVGIGTATPSRPLHLKGTGEVAMRIEGDASSPDAQIETSFAGVRRWTFGSTGNNHPTPNAFYVYQDTNRSNFSIGQTRLLIDENGNVGIGTTAPTSPLQVEAYTGGFGIFSRNTFNLFSQGGGGILGQTTSKDGTGVVGRYDGPASSSGWGVHGFSPTGYAGVFGSGNTNGVFGLTGNANASGVFGKNDTGGAGVAGLSESGIGVVGNSNNGDGIVGTTQATNKTSVLGLAGRGSNAVAGISSHKDGVGGYFQNTGGGTALKVIGTADIGTLRITGADVAEPFEVAAVGTLEPGTVMAIDPQHPGQLRVSAQAYDRRVAGVISGAGGINTGLTLKQSGTLADGAHPVALSGRVYCRADAGYGAIKPGDLLTTSNTPGHAMKVTHHRKAQGAIIGKALTGLKASKGLVLVLVTLQ